MVIRSRYADSHIFLGWSRSRLSTLSPELHQGDINTALATMSAAFCTLWCTSPHLGLPQSAEHETKLCDPQPRGCSESHSSPAAWLLHSPLSAQPSETPGVFHTYFNVHFCYHWAIYKSLSLISYSGRVTQVDCPTCDIINSVMYSWTSCHMSVLIITSCYRTIFEKISCMHV